MDKEQLVLFEGMKDCLEDLSGVDGDGLGEEEEVYEGELAKWGLVEEDELVS